MAELDFSAFKKPARRRRRTSAASDVLIGYRRVSTREQADSGAGMAAQHLVIDTWAKANGKTIVWLEDDGYSAATIDKRPALVKALTMIRNGQAGGIVVAKLDRLSRSMLDFVLLLEDSQRYNWQLVALDFGLDTSTPAGEMMIGILMLFAQFERRLISQRTKDGLAAKKAAGVRLGAERVISDELLREVCGIFLDCGEGYAATARSLNVTDTPTATGKGRWHPDSVRKLLLTEYGAAALIEARELDAVMHQAAASVGGRTEPSRTEPSTVERGEAA
jgi:DNA invertase Pin-like site-specific DNA recombinase